MAKHLLVVFTNARDGQEEEFNDWYTARHVPDTLAVPGFTAGQRFRFGDAQLPGTPDCPHKYLAVYEIDSDDLEGALNALKSTKRYVSGALDTSDITAYAFTAISPRTETS